MFKNLFKNRAFLSIFSSIIIFIIIYFVSSFWVFSWINERINSSLIWIRNEIYRNSNKRILNDDIVIVTIDEKTTKSLWRFPFDRKYYASVIEKLNEWWASIIWLDIIFASENKENPKSDKILEEAFKKAWNIVLWWAILVSNLNNKASLVIEKPLEKFYEKVAWFGYYTPEMWKNWIVFSFKPTRNLSDEDLVVWNYNHFWIEILKKYYSKIYGKDFSKNYWKDENFFFLRENEKIPFIKNKSDEVFINFIPAVKTSDKLSYFTNYSFLDIYEWKIDPKNFKDKIIIIWNTEKAQSDSFQTINWMEYWVFIHANIINTITTKNFLYYFPEYLEWMLIFLVIILSIYFSLSSSWKVVFFANLIIFFIFILILPVFLTTFFSSYIFSHLFEIFLTLPFSIATWNALKFMAENNNKYKLSKALSEYVSKAIVKDILSSNWDLKLDWELKNLSIFFSDIEWFTSISEKFTPQELVLFLREYLSYMSNIILDNNWFINKYEWDAIMALWWTFAEHSKDSYNSCLSALEQQEKLKEANLIWQKRWLPEVKARIWLHSWEAIVWNIWAVWRKIEYTALWDAVNLASRLEWINKFYGTFICASENIYEKNKDFFEFRYIDKITVKWKEKPIKIYELLSMKWKLSDEKKDIVNNFNIAIENFNLRNFLDAKKIFTEIYEKYKDPPSKTYIERCEYYLLNKPEDEKELIWKYETK